jgi:hypothetical protein
MAEVSPQRGHLDRGATREQPDPRGPWVAGVHWDHRAGVRYDQMSLIRPNSGINPHLHHLPNVL